MKSINVKFEDDVFEDLLKRKEDTSWEKFIIKKSRYLSELNSSELSELDMVIPLRTSEKIFEERGYPDELEKIGFDYHFLYRTPYGKFPDNLSIPLDTYNQCSLNKNLIVVIAVRNKMKLREYDFFIFQYTKDDEFKKLEFGEDVVLNYTELRKIKEFFNDKTK